MQLHIAGGHPAKHIHRCCPPQDLLNSRIHQLGIGPQQRPLVGVFNHGVDAMADGIAGGLVASHCQQQDEHVELVVGEGIVALGRHQDAENVITGGASAVSSQRFGVHVQFGRRCAGIVEATGVVRIADGDHPVGPLEHLAAVLNGNAQHLGNGDEGQLGGNTGDEFHLAGVHCLSHQTGGDVGVVVGHELDGPGSEAPIDQTAHAGVLGWVDINEHAGFFHVAAVIGDEDTLGC